MNLVLPLAASVLVLVAVSLLLAARSARGQRGLALADYLESMDGVITGPARLAEDEAPFLERVLRPAGRGLSRHIGRFTPRGHLDGLHRELLRAGLATKIRAEEFAAIEFASVVGMGLCGTAIVVTTSPPGRMVLVCLVGLPVIGFLAARSWLAQAVQERQDAIRRDLPDVLDLLSLSVQAGLGFEAAIETVSERLPSPLGVELRLTLREMELGRSRREAFANLKRRTDVPDLNGFVSAVVQADALGVPIGRVLQAQAAEMRLRRRQWARETAAKLPVKILFPLVVFVFPAIFVVILGPSIGPLRDALG